MPYATFLILHHEGENPEIKNAGPVSKAVGG